MKRKAFAQIPLIIGLLLMAIAIPVATSLVQQSQENRGKAAGTTPTPRVCTIGNLGTACTNNLGQSCQLYRLSDCSEVCNQNCHKPDDQCTAGNLGTACTSSNGQHCQFYRYGDCSQICNQNCSGPTTAPTSVPKTPTSVPNTPTSVPNTPTPTPTTCTCVNGKWSGSVASCGHSLGYSCTTTCVAATCNSDCINKGSTSGTCNSSNQCMCSTVPTPAPTSNTCDSFYSNLDCWGKSLGGSCIIPAQSATVPSVAGTCLNSGTLSSGKYNCTCSSSTPTTIPAGWTNKYCPGNSGVEAICDIAVPPVCSATGCHPGQCTGSFGYAHCINNTVTPIPSPACILDKWDCGNNGVWHCESSGGSLTWVLKQGCGADICVKAVDGSSASCQSPGTCNGSSTDTNCKGLDPSAPCGAGKSDGSYICTSKDTGTTGLNCSCTTPIATPTVTCTITQQCAQGCAQYGENAVCSGGNCVCATATPTPQGGCVIGSCCSNGHTCIAVSNYANACGGSVCGSVPTATPTINPGVTARPTTAAGCDSSKYNMSGYDSATKIWLHFDDEYTAKCICTGSTTGTAYHYVCTSGYWACGDGSKVVQVCTPTPTSVICKTAVGKEYTLNDYSIWRSEYVEGSYGTVSKDTWQSDFDCDGKVTLNDYSIWRQNYINAINGVTL